jgi:hypothetical protein
VDGSITDSSASEEVEKGFEEEQESSHPEWDADEIEEAKAAEERRAIEECDLLVTKPNPKDLIRQRFLYLKE